MVLPLQLLAEEKKKMGEEKAIEIQEQNKVIAVEKAEAEAALDQIKPIMEAAKREVEKLDKAEVTELRWLICVYSSINSWNYTERPLFAGSEP